jgi:pyruvate kinase
MILAGVDVCRINMSHGKHDDLQAVITHIRNIDEELGTHTAILADLQGPKLRVGVMEGDGVMMPDGHEFIITTNETIGTADKVFMTYQAFPVDVKPGEKILMDDGKLEMEVLATNGKDEVRVRVLQGGVLSSKKGVNLPNTRVSLPCLTEKDLVDLEFVLEQPVDWIGLSFVRSARDIIELKHFILRAGKSHRVVAKIEKPEALEDIDAIIRETDAIMVARGDLGVEIPLQNVPLIQKDLIKRSLYHAKPIIVATQMMESMITNSSPTRAEVNDVANAVLDGADAVMLSGETSVGKHPVLVIKTMRKIVEQMETSEQIYFRETEPERNHERFIADSMCFNAARLAKRVGAEAIITMTHSGYTAYKISSQRPKGAVFVFTANRRILSALSLVWGVKCFYYDKMVSTDHTIADSKYILKKGGFIKDGDLIINVASMPIEEKGQSNMVKLSYA